MPSTPRPSDIARACWHALPTDTRAHTHAAAAEAVAAARSLADGVSEGVEAAIDRVSLLLNGRPRK